MCRQLISLYIPVSLGLISTVRKSICPACTWKIYDLNTGYLKARSSADPGSAWDVGVVPDFGGCPLILSFRPDWGGHIAITESCNGR